MKVHYILPVNVNVKIREAVTAAYGENRRIDYIELTYNEAIELWHYLSKHDLSFAHSNVNATVAYSAELGSFYGVRLKVEAAPLV